MEIVVPALSPRSRGGDIDLPSLVEYITRARDSWITKFIIAGSTDAGYALTSRRRVHLLDLWLTLLPPSRIVMCCWSPPDVEAARQRSVDVLATSLSHGTQSLSNLPSSVLAYSHPRRSPIAVTPCAIREARRRKALVRGAKVSKVTVERLSAIRGAAGDGFLLWDGTSRHLETSQRAGATAAVCAPLAAMPDPFPPQHPLSSLQHRVDELNNLVSRPGLDKHLRLRSLAFGTKGCQL